MPNSYDEPFKEEEMKQQGKEAHIQWKAHLLRLQKQKVKSNEAVLVLNFEKNNLQNYIGGGYFSGDIQRF